MSFRRMLAIARKEALHILRDWRSLAMALAVPVLMLLLFGYALSLDVDRIPTLIYDASNTPQSRELAARFEGSRFFRVLGEVSRHREMEEAVLRDRCLLGVVIPPDYARRLLAGEEAPVQLLIDGSDSNTAAIALGYAEALIQDYGFELRRRWLDRMAGAEFKAPVEPRLRVFYNHTLESKNYIVPGLIAVILMIIAALLTSLTIAREWETGTMEQLLSTPVRPAELVLGKMLAYFVLGLVDTLTAVAAGVLVFHVPLRGNPLMVVLSSCVFLVGALFWGILISAAARSQLLAYQASMVTSFLPAFLLSGFVYAIENMPVPVQIVTYGVPARYFITLLKGVFLKGVGLKVLWGELALLAVFAAAVFFAATRKVRQRLA